MGHLQTEAKTRTAPRTVPARAVPLLRPDESLGESDGPVVLVSVVTPPRRSFPFVVFGGSVGLLLGLLVITWATARSTVTATSPLGATAATLQPPRASPSSSALTLLAPLPVRSPPPPPPPPPPPVGASSATPHSENLPAQRRPRTAAPTSSNHVKGTKRPPNAGQAADPMSYR